MTAYMLDQWCREVNAGEPDDPDAEWVRIGDCQYGDVIRPAGWYGGFRVLSVESGGTQWGISRVSRWPIAGLVEVRWDVEHRPLPPEAVTVFHEDELVAMVTP